MVTTFTVNELGEIKNIKVIQFVDVESATEIIRVLKNAPKWEPATRGGKPISIEIKFPLNFKLLKKEWTWSSLIFSKIDTSIFFKLFVTFIPIKQLINCVELIKFILAQ